MKQGKTLPDSVSVWLSQELNLRLSDCTFRFLSPNHGHHRKHHLNGFKCQLETGHVTYINQFCRLTNNHNHSVVYTTNIFITHGELVSWAALLQAGGGVQVGSICCILEPRLEEHKLSRGSSFHDRSLKWQKASPSTWVRFKSLLASCPLTSLWVKQDM